MTCLFLHKSIRLCLILLTNFLWLSAHSQSNSNRHSHYFPFIAAAPAKTYIYVNDLEPSDTARWVLRAFVSGKDTLLEIKIYIGKEISEETIERITQGNVYLRSYTVYRDKKAARCQILDSVIYMSQFIQGQAYGWNVQYTDPVNKATLQLTKSRKPEAESNSARTYTDQMTLKDIASNKVYPYSARFQYTVGKGLTRYEIIVDGKMLKSYVLKKQ